MYWSHLLNDMQFFYTTYDFFYLISIFMSIKFSNMLFNFSNNIYMLWSHLLYVTNNIYMLVFKQHIHVGNLFVVCYTISKQHMYGICSP